MNIEQLQKEIQEIKLATMQMQQLASEVNKLTQQVSTITDTIEKPQMPTAPTLTIKEVARMAGLHPNTVKKDINNGVLKVVHRGDRKRVLAESASEYINPK